MKYFVLSNYFLRHNFNKSFFSTISNNLFCINCKHFIPHFSKYTFNDPEHNLLYGTCNLFGTQDLVTGKKIYFKAFICREYKHLCGKDAKHFSHISDL